MITRESPTHLYQEARLWLEEDFQRVENALGGRSKKFLGKRVLVTGAAGFLGFNFLHFFSYLNAKSSCREPVTVVAADNYLRGQPRWLQELIGMDPNIVLRRCDITKPWLPNYDKYDFIIHGACIASPVYYRKYPLETVDANVTGLRNMLELSREAASTGILYFSSSEIYGDPPAHEIPTAESYRGNVTCLGPRACYDESKRVGETLCYVYVQQYRVPVKIVRPFNNYGPGLRMTDGRVLPDLCGDALAGRDVVLYSNGSPTRTFCYVSDALAGYLLVLLSPYNGEPFNIGCDAPEVTMRQLASLILKISGGEGEIAHELSQDSDYLEDNPNRRCPDISKARSLLGFSPGVTLEHGVSRMLEWYRNFSRLDEVAEAEMMEDPVVGRT